VRVIVWPTFAFLYQFCPQINKYFIAYYVTSPFHHTETMLNIAYYIGGQQTAMTLQVVGNKPLQLAVHFTAKITLQ